MNETLEKTTKTGEWDYKHKADTWAKLPDFQMTPLSIASVLQYYGIAIIVNNYAQVVAF
jgi:hypothetical protein